MPARSLPDLQRQLYLIGLQYFQVMSPDPSKP